MQCQAFCRCTKIFLDKVKIILKSGIGNNIQVTSLSQQAEESECGKVIKQTPKNETVLLFHFSS